MGSEMAFNLFSKRLSVEKDPHFVVCDAIQDNANKFCNNFASQFPGAHLSVAETPKQYAAFVILASSI